MRILLANNTLCQFAGSEIWTYMLALELKRQGHKVECFSRRLGVISARLEQQQVVCRHGFRERTRRFARFFGRLKYDVIIANHNHVVDELRLTFPRTAIK